MTRRSLLLFGLPVALVVLGVGGWLLLPRTAVNEENCRKIMDTGDYTEVEALLGTPDEQTLIISPVHDDPLNEPTIRKRWVAGRDSMAMEFREDGAVLSAIFERGPYPLPVEWLPGGWSVAEWIWGPPMSVKTYMAY
jgi:hypothetical protein